MAFIVRFLHSLEGVFFIGQSDVTWWRIFGVSSGLSFTMGFLLIGIPGALGMTIMQWAIRRLGVETPNFSEATWGIAILVSLMLPLFIPVAHFALRWGFPKSFGSLLLFGIAWSVLLCSLAAITDPK
jgi:hypothetical protein